MRVIIAAFLVTGTSAFRKAVSHNAAKAGVLEDHPHMHSQMHSHMHSHMHPHPGVPAPFPGYLVHEGFRCAGQWIQFWENGDYALYGQSAAGHEYSQPLECARECNEHQECTGFYSRDGVCSYWRSGTLQGAHHRHAFGQDCYVKTSTENLDNAHAGPIAHSTSLKRPEGPQISDCLCVFDIDRTLTARKGWTDCPGTEEQTGVMDYFQTSGTMILSDMARGLKDSAACGQCYYGLVSAGTASGPNSGERDVLDGLVDPRFDVGGYVDGCPSPVSGTKVMACGHGGKTRAVADIVAWLGENGVHIQPHRAHFFDDKARNVQGFVGGPYNAHQVSCGSRDNLRGGCGGSRAEFNDIPIGPAQHFC